MLELTAPLPFASLDLGTFPLWLLMLMYAAIAAGIWPPIGPLEEKEEKLHKPYNRTWKIYPRRRLIEMTAG